MFLPDERYLSITAIWFMDAIQFLVHLNPKLLKLGRRKRKGLIKRRGRMGEEKKSWLQGKERREKQSNREQ